MAKFYFRYGAMNCGKTTALLQVAHNYEERGLNVLLIKPRIDTKSGKNVFSRIGMKREVDFLADNDMQLYDTVHQWDKDVEAIDCVLVDEAQFLTPIQVEQLFNLTVYDDIPVICYGLRTDFKTQLFPGSARLLALAHSIEEMKTICRCGKKAVFNARYVNDEFSIEGSQVAIDNSSQMDYVSLCADCYFRELEFAVKH